MLLAVALVISGLALLPAGCEKDRAPPLAPAKSPYMGVVCRKPNSDACDRVGLAVFLKRPAVRLTASIAGRSVRMRHAGFVRRRGTGWEGFLRPAGLTWQCFAVVRLRAYFGDGSAASRSIRVWLTGGWG